MSDILGILENLEDQEIDYVVERSKVNRDSHGYQNAGLSKNTFYSWSTERREKLNEIAQSLKREKAVRALLKLQSATEDAAQVLIDQLKLKRSPNVQQKAATEILDRTMGKATQKVEQENSGETKIIIEHVEKPID